MAFSERNIVVIGAGIGGLTAAAMLAAEGAPVTVLETGSIPGGCAATFQRNGCRFDAGATVGCGFHPGGPMHRLGRELGIRWPVEREHIAWQYRQGVLLLDLSSTRKEILGHFPRSASFWQEQGALSRLLWHLSAGGLAWPPKTARDLALLLQKGISGLSGTARLLPFVSRNAYEWLASHGLHADPLFMRFIDAQLMISAQTTARHAHALNAAIALDLPVSGAWRVRGGIGSVAALLARSIEERGGAVLFGKRVVRIDAMRCQVLGLETADGSAIAADLVIANLTPDSLARLLGDDAFPVLGPKGPSPEWSAFMLYLAVDSGVFPDAFPRHLQLVAPDGELGEGNSIFMSVSPPGEQERAPRGLAAVTISTHTRPDQWFRARSESRERYQALKASYTERVLDLLESQLPGVRQSIRFMEAGTPFTWERYTGRYRGFVGSYPQTGLFDVRGPETGFDNLFLVGDSIFPGQSLPGVVTGARRVVELVRRQEA